MLGHVEWQRFGSLLHAMKSTFVKILVLLLTCIPALQAGAQCNSGCTTTISAATAGNTYSWLTSGTYCIPNGIAFTGSMTLASGSTLNICGKFTGSITIQGGTVNNYGILAPSSFSSYTGTLNNYDSVYYNNALTLNSGTINNYGKMRVTGNFTVTAGTFVQDGISLFVGGKLDVTNNSTMTIAAGDSVRVNSLEVNTYSLTNNSFLRVNNNMFVNSGATFTNTKTLSVGGNLENNATFVSTDSVYVSGATKSNTGTFTVSGDLVTPYIYNNGTFTADGANIKIDSLLSNTSGTFTMKNGGTLQTKNLENYGTITSSGSGTPVITVTGNSTNTGTMTGTLDFCDYSGSGTPDNNGGTTGGGVTFCNSALPVTWQHFSATWVAPNTGLLSWVTAQEVNNSHFVVLRSTDGRSWEEIAELSGSGTTAQSTRYHFRDEYLPFRAKVIYYRICQVDFDGKSAFSNIVKITPGARQAALITFNNPVQNQLHLQFNAPVKGQVTLRITDLAGREVFVYETTGDVALGYYGIQLSELPTGIYGMVLVQGEEVLLNEKLMIR